MVATARLDKLRELLEPAVKAAGMELWGLEFLPQGRHSVLRVFIDAPGGVTIDHCEAVSHQVSAVLDVEDPIAGEYHLEVSSPGLDRPLFTLGQCERFVGEQVKVRLRSAVAGKRRFNAVITGVSEDACLLSVDGEQLAIPMSVVEKMNLIPRFD